LCLPKSGVRSRLIADTFRRNPRCPFAELGGLDAEMEHEISFSGGEGGDLGICQTGIIKQWERIRHALKAAQKGRAEKNHPMI